MKPTYILFASGWGGTSFGFNQAGWQSKLEIDIEPTNYLPPADAVEGEEDAE